mgnify:CR=1 FL=1
MASKAKLSAQQELLELLSSENDFYMTNLIAKKTFQQHKKTKLKL